MFRLSAKNDWQKCKWYFRKMKHVKKFIAYFENCGCNVSWEINEADTFPEMDADDMNEMYRKPKERAKDEEDWMFNSYLKDNPNADVSSSISEKLMKNILRTQDKIITEEVN